MTPDDSPRNAQPLSPTLADHTGEPQLLGPALTGGFATAVGVWCAWFVTHLPWLGIPEQVSIPVLLAVWVVMAALSFRIAGVPATGTRAWTRGALTGAISALLGLLILGSKINADESGIPGAGLIAVSFVALGAVIGLVGTALATLLPSPTSRPGWLPRLAIVAVFAVAPLLFVGGLVTSTNSGMAVPDWPNTFGSNMFLYPLGPRARPDVYLEHSHRLFGSLVGLATLTLMIGVLRLDNRRWVRRWAVVAFALVCVQGILGGIRVLAGDAEIARDNRFYAMLHGVLAQLVFAVLVALAVFLTPAYRALRRQLAGVCDCGSSLRAGADSAATCPQCSIASDLTPPLPSDDAAGWGAARRLRAFATGAAHATILQLILGAMYRHFRSDHALWTHAGFSILVVIFAVAAGFGTQALPPMRGPAGHVRDVLRRVGIWLVAVVGLQFLLGWVTFAVGGRGHEADSPVQALIRTVHQANGALLLALATVLYIWSRAMAPRRPAAEAPAVAASRHPAPAPGLT